MTKQADTTTSICRFRTGLFVLLCTALVTLAGCDTQSGSNAPLSIRTPHPTFTPTLAAAQPQPVATPEPPVGGESTGSGATAAGGANAITAKAVVNSPIVNVRTGPGTDFDVVTMVERGAEYDIIAKSSDGAWWQVCCVDGAEVWIIGEYVDTDGPVDSVPVAGQPSEAAPAATAADAPPAAQSSGEFTFDLRMQEQFPETGLVRIFLYVYSGNNSLAGYSLRVVHNGAELPVEGTSFAGQPAFTWPFQDARQRYQNFKVEFSDVDPAGTWEVQIIDSDGNAVGPSATFTLAANDPQQELYVRYEQR